MCYLQQNDYAKTSQTKICHFSVSDGDNDEFHRLKPLVSPLETQVSH